jgi:uncharacterized protein YndB with AHSA1/START domain
VSTTLHTSGERPTLRIERRLAHPPTKVWRALTEPAELSKWYPFAARSIDLRVGGMIHFDDGAGTEMEAQIMELDPPRVFAFSERAPESMPRESQDLIRFELQPLEQGCLLIFTHTYNDLYGSASYASGWNVCLDALEHAVAGTPFPEPGPMDQAHERFVAAFGLNEGVASTTPEGWRVRFERQLVRPTAAVWSLLSGDHAAAPGDPAPEGATVAEFPAGPLTAAEPQALMEYTWLAEGRPAGRVRWELSNGTGHGARVVLVQTGPHGTERMQQTALAAWQARIEALAAQLLRTPRAAPVPAP